jgi:hypothetical protein
MVAEEVVAVVAVAEEVAAAVAVQAKPGQTQT